MPLILLKSALFGVLVAVCTLVVWIAGTLIIGLAWLHMQVSSGAGGLGAVSFGIPGTTGLLVMVTSFGAGSAVMYRRLHRRLAR